MSNLIITFPSKIQFVNEKGVVIDQQVDYDLLPISCSIYKGVGHNYASCTHNKKQLTLAKKIMGSQN